MQQTEAYTARNTNLCNLYKYLHFILFHIFHLLTEKQWEYRAKENQVEVPLPSKGHVLQWFELADELYYSRVVLLIHKSSKHL